MTVVLRPMRLLWLAASVALVVALGGSAILFRAHLDDLMKTGLPYLVGVPIGVVISSAIFAGLLRVAVRIVGRFAFAFSEAWLVSVVTTALNVLALLPVALIQMRIYRTEDGARLLVIMGVINIVLTIAAYSFLIRNALGRPIGIARGVLTYLLLGAVIGVLGGISAGIAAFTWRRH